jgi:anti-anti-sigma factor
MILELHAEPKEVMRAVEALQHFAREKGVMEQAIFGLALALEECGSNIVNHAMKGDAREKFQVSLEHTGDTFVIELRDHGSEFDPTIREARLLDAADDALPGGWGIQLVRRYIDDIRYTRLGDQNILRLTKRLGDAGKSQSISPPSHSKSQPKNQTTIRMPLEIQIQKNISGKNAGTVTVKLDGSLDTATAPDLERELGPVITSDVKDVVFDLANLKFISSAGLRIFAATRKPLQARGGNASFVNLQPQIQEVFEIIKALPGVSVFESVDEMDRYLAARQRAVSSSS